MKRHFKKIPCSLLLLLAACNPCQDASYEDNGIVDELRCRHSTISQLFGGPFVADKNLTDYLERVTSRLAKVGDLTDQLKQALVLSEDRPICIASLNGEIMLSRGLLLSLDNEAELATLIALNLSHQNSIFGQHSPSRVLTTSEIEKALEWVRCAGYDQNAINTLSEKLPDLNLFSLESDQGTMLKKRAGYLGEHAYQNALTFLKEHVSVYHLISQAEKSLSQGAWNESLSLAEKGLEVLPDEPTLFAIKGTALMALSDFAGALEAFNRSINLSPTYHHYYLKRGQLYAQMASYEEARADFQHALALLPTQEAKEALEAVLQP